MKARVFTPVPAVFTAQILQLAMLQSDPSHLFRVPLLARPECPSFSFVFFFAHLALSCHVHG